MVQTVVDAQVKGETISLRINNQAEGDIGINAMAIGCSNPKCLKTTVTAAIGSVVYGSYGPALAPNRKRLFDQRLLPQGSANPQPEYIPLALREDYHEACLIRDLSPKASATLTRRCLQGMIRDFAGITKPSLNEEIKALKAAVADGTADRSISAESVEAIDHVRGVGNIGAHMEKDIDLIIEVDPGEAQALIELVEMLFDEWYGARERRKSRLARVSEIAGDKKAIKDGHKTQAALPAPASDGNSDIVNALLGITATS